MRNEKSKESANFNNNNLNKEIIEKLGTVLDRKMKALPDGTHRLNNKAIFQILESIKLQPNDIVWEIGCGNPVLGLSYSYQLESNKVILTDLKDTVTLIKTILTKS